MLPWQGSVHAPEPAEGVEADGRDVAAVHVGGVVAEARHGGLEALAGAAQPVQAQPAQVVRLHQGLVHGQRGVEACQRRLALP
jgi:hypothetical protein